MAIRTFRIKIDGKVFEAEVEEIGATEQVPTTQKVQHRPVSPPPPPLQTSGGGSSIIAPMPGKIISLNVKQGDHIKEGDVVLVLEAMKMEQQIKSTLSGTVKEILVAPGDTVKKEQPLIILA